MAKAFIFDMDGVIVDSEGPMFEADTGFFTTHGIEYDVNEIYKALGRANYHYTMIKKAMVSPTLSDEELREKYDIYFDPANPIHHRDHRALRTPHILELLDGLKAAGLKLAVASSADLPMIEEVVQACEIADYFDVLVSGCDFEESKPNPAIYLHTLERLGVQAQDAFVIEDSPNGITAAKSAGIPTIAKVENRFPIDQSHADYFVDDLLEVLDIVLG